MSNSSAAIDTKNLSSVAYYRGICIFSPLPIEEVNAYFVRGKYRTVQFLREGLKIPDILEKYTKELEELRDKLAQSKTAHPELINPTNCERWIKHAWGKDWETSCFIWYCNIAFLLNHTTIHDDDLIGINVIKNELRDTLFTS